MVTRTLNLEFNNASDLWFDLQEHEEREEQEREREREREREKAGGEEDDFLFFWSLSIYLSSKRYLYLRENNTPSLIIRPNMI